MKSTSRADELEAHYQAFIKEKDYDRFCSRIASYFHFIEDTYPFREIKNTLFSAKSSPAILSNVHGLYQMFVFNKRDPRFSISPLTVSGSGVATFHRLLKEEAGGLGITSKAKYLTMENDSFFYNKAKLKISAGTYAYDILRTVYTLLDGESGEISYKDLFKELRKIGRFKSHTDEWILDKIQKYVTSTTDGLGTKVKSVENNGLKLVDVNKGEGIIFNNG